MSIKKYIYRGAPETMFNPIIEHPLKNSTAKILLIKVLSQRIDFQFTVSLGMGMTKTNNNSVIRALKVLEENGFLARIKRGRNKVDYYWFETTSMKAQFLRDNNAVKRIRRNTIHHEDCLETMSKMRDNFLDMCITSPPYDNLRTYYDSQYAFPFEEIAIELHRVMKTGGVVVWIVGDATIDKTETLTSFRQALFFRSIGFLVHDTMIYQKTYFKNSGKNRYYSNFEYMFILSKDTPPRTANLLIDRKNKTAGNAIRGTQRTRDGRLISKSGIGKKINEYGLRGNIWSYATGLNGSTRDKFAFKHPAILPEKLVEDHIQTWSNPGDLIYDCFGGSGTTGKIAKLLGREYIMSELVDKYIPLMKKRVKIKP